MRDDLELYRSLGFDAFHIDRGGDRASDVAFAREQGLPYYVDHAADKGWLHLTDRHGRARIMGKREVLSRPHSLADPATLETLEGFLRANVEVTRNGPVLAYAFDDEPSLGSFTSPVEVDGSARSVAGYRKWLQSRYGSIESLNRSWGTELAAFSEVWPRSFGQVRPTNAPFAQWNLAPWCDWRSYMDDQFAATMARLTRFTNGLDPNTPAGFVGGQQPAPYGGYDYAKLARSVQWIESYDIGGTNEILRSLWRHPERRPHVQTWFSSGDARRDGWFLWYYLLHGNRGVIAWPEHDRRSWFRYGDDGRPAPFIRDNVETIREVQSELSRHILDPDLRFDADPVAVLYSHPSVQVSWAMDATAHGNSWHRRFSRIDNRCQSAGKNRVAWFKLLEDAGFQYEVITGEQVAAGGLSDGGYRVLVLNRAVALSAAEAEAIRGFVNRGGTVIADHLTGLFDESGRGRPEGGVLDDLFGLRRDEARGYLNGSTVAEIDGELHQRPYAERLRSHRGALRHEGMTVYERGTIAVGAPQDEKGGGEYGEAAARVGGADVLIERRIGEGRALYLNLSPIAYYDLNARLSSEGEAWRRLIAEELGNSGLLPRARVTAGGRPVPLAEVVYWRKGDRVTVGVIKNPTRQSAVDAVGEIDGLGGEPLEIEIRFAETVRDVVDLRSGAAHPDGEIIRARWNPWEALLFGVTLPEPGLPDS
ncbi:hypothetical protein ABI59_16965 [Acidobacteria bacterium Mor1]|nr:hypothetical protein ABI59_16965 [Acidobacteria bacterium Mor1]